jgi:hypothetical protein
MAQLAYAKKERVAAPKKERITVSLSRDAVEYLESARAEAQAASMSAYFETIVRDLQAKAEMAAIEAATVAYYDNLGAGEIDEQAEWGRVGAASLSRLDG